jgi:hypothetical protein
MASRMTQEKRRANLLQESDKTWYFQEIETFCGTNKS